MTFWPNKTRSSIGDLSDQHITKECWWLVGPTHHQAVRPTPGQPDLVSAKLPARGTQLDCPTGVQASAPSLVPDPLGGAPPEPRAGECGRGPETCSAGAAHHHACGLVVPRACGCAVPVGRIVPLHATKPCKPVLTPGNAEPASATAQLHSERSGRAQVRASTPPLQQSCIRSG